MPYPFWNMKNQSPIFRLLKLLFWKFFCRFLEIKCPFSENHWMYWLRVSLHKKWSFLLRISSVKSLSKSLSKPSLAKSPNKGFYTENRYVSMPIYPWRWAYWLNTKRLFFRLVFKYLITFTVTVWQRVKRGPSKERSQELTSDIFSTTSTMRRVIRIMKNFDMWIYIDLSLSCWWLELAVPQKGQERSHEGYF